MWTSSAILYISLFCHKQTPILLFSYSFHVSCIIFSNVYVYIVRSMFLFLFNWSQSKASVTNQMSHLLFEVQKYFFILLNFLKIVIFTRLLRRWSTLWNLKLQKTALFRHCLTLLISALKLTTLIWRCSTLKISTLNPTYPTIFQLWFDIVWCRDVISH